MFRQWALSSLSLCTLIASVAFWIASEFYAWGGSHAGNIEYGIRVYRGAIYIDRQTDVIPYGWNCYFEPTPDRPVLYDSQGVHFLKFSGNLGNTSTMRFIGIPCWFLVTLVLMTNLYLWTRSRRHFNPGFPVEPAKTTP